MKHQIYNNNNLGASYLITLPFQLQRIYNTVRVHETKENSLNKQIRKKRVVKKYRVQKIVTTI